MKYPASPECSQPCFKSAAEASSFLQYPKTCWVPHHDLAAARLTCARPNLRFGGHRRVRSAGLDLALVGQSIGSQQLSLAVQGGQRHAHRVEQLEGVGAKRRPADGRRAQPREAQPVPQRAEQEQQGRSACPVRARQAPPSFRARTGAASTGRLHHAHALALRRGQAVRLLHHSELPRAYGMFASDASCSTTRAQRGGTFVTRRITRGVVRGRP